MQIEREIVFPASPEEVWEALTDPERLEEWFANDVELDPRPGGEGTFRWDDDGQVVIELEEVGDGTVVHVTETAPDFAIALELHAFAWTRVG